MMTRSSDMTLRMWDSEGNLLKTFDERKTDALENISKFNDGTFISWSQKGSVYLWEQSMDSCCQVNFPEKPCFESFEIEAGGVIVLSDNCFLVWRSADLISIISVHKKTGELKSILEIPKLQAPAYHSSYPVTDFGVRKTDDGELLITSRYSALIVNQELEVLKVFNVPDQYRDRTSDTSDNNGVGHINFMAGGIYPIEDGRYLSASVGIVYLWNKNKAGIFEIESAFRPSYKWTTGAFSLKRLDKHFRAITTDNFVYLTDGINEFISHVPKYITNIMNPNYQLDIDTSFLSDIYLNFHKNREISGHAMSIIETMKKQEMPMIHIDNIVFTLMYAEDGYLVDHQGEVVARYHHPLINITYGFSDNYSHKNPTNRLLDLNGDTMLKTKSGTRLHWLDPLKAEKRRLFNDGRAVVTLSDGQLCVLRTYMGNQRISLEELEQNI
jgi:hypothetical protein